MTFRYLRVKVIALGAKTPRFFNFSVSDTGDVRVYQRASDHFILDHGLSEQDEARIREIAKSYYDKKGE